MTTLLDHLAGGLTTVCRAWAVTRRDGVAYGFTDHDRALDFDGRTFRADAGMSARAIVQGTGLAVDNSEALGVLSDTSVRDADIEAGLFDGATVEMWLVNWRDATQRMLRFRGQIGEIRRGAGAFHAELRGLTEALNQPQGRVIQRACSAILGDARCRFDLASAGYREGRAAETVQDGRVFRFGVMDTFQDRWFERGRLTALSGGAAGLSGTIKHDRLRADGSREIELWEPLRGTVAAGDTLRLDAGCDKRAATCRLKFNNMVNFQGFPFIPGEDWLTSVPTGDGTDNGGSLRR